MIADLTRLKPRLVIWDSLFFDFLARHPLACSKIATALLVHYLPSLNPDLDSATQIELKHRETTVIHNCGLLICTGSAIFQMLSRDHPDKPLFRCRPGVDKLFKTKPEKKFKADQAETVTLVSVANILPAKGYLDLLEALSRLRKERWIWHIVGDDAEDRAFSALFRGTAGTLHLTSRIRFHGVLSPERLANLFLEMDLFVNASRHESYGMAVAEAVAVGLPVVSTRIGDAEDLVRHGQSGILVPVGDGNALQNALGKFIQNVHLRKEFRRNNLTHSPESWENCFENFKKACKSIPDVH